MKPAVAETFDEIVFKNKADLIWEKMLPELGDDSPVFAILRVDPQTSATTLMIEFPKALHIPKHTHEKSETHIILGGAHVFEDTTSGQRFDVREYGWSTSMDKPLTIVAITTAVPGHESELRAAQEKLVSETVNERGCLRYELHQSIEDGRILVFTESWASEEDWKAHMQGAAIKRFHASGASNLIQDFSLLRMNFVAG
jgi:quinol monooxygenase YgiN